MYLSDDSRHAIVRVVSRQPACLSLGYLNQVAMFPCHLNKDGHDVYGFDPPVALNCVCFYSGHVVVFVTPVGLSDPRLQRA